MTVTAHTDGPVGLITLDRPEKRNALNAAMIDGIVHALEAHEADPAVRAIVLTGTGDRAFCAGMDLTRVSSSEPGAPTTRPETSTYKRLLTDGSTKPLIAAVNGTAVAGGFELMLACDLVISAPHARFGLPEVARGLVAGAGGTFLPLRIPRAVAFELALTAEAIDATRAHALGLVNHVVPADEVLPRALALATTIAANSPHAVRLTRGLLRDATDLSAAEAWSHVDAAVTEVLAGPDAREGAQAFLERRTPQWT
ncbi:enoyl-CoA hydratase/isomerase family protein [Nocardioides daejeonensis]|uniref:enoyl-CoA hydratase/isomerase family protein n=1 Tax=Nocardioides daejeonensis TaxID=1046556 RepID=UPI000D745C3B|nr:enoyl-CoA hydratase-related protein [Nocardioides daejeonensis]